jgi:hypothetical protein
VHIIPNPAKCVPKAAEEYTRFSDNARGELENMPSPEKDRVAAEVVRCWADFQEGLSSNKRKYPLKQFSVFWTVTKRCVELTKSDSLIHRHVACAANGLVAFLEVERKRVPADVLRDVERLECLVFSGYDPYSGGPNLSVCSAGRPPDGKRTQIHFSAIRTRGDN